MIRLLLALVLALGLALPASALTEAELSGVGVSPPAGARLPLGLAVVDSAGRPTTIAAAAEGKPIVFVAADYRCKYLCGPALALTAAALSRTRLEAGRDYRLLVLGIDPKDGAADARAFAGPLLAGAPQVRPATQLLLGEPPAIAAATRALGYRYRWDAEHGQFAHPAAAFVLAPDGRLVRVLSEIQIQPEALQSAVRAAAAGPPAQGALAPIAAGLHALCYAFDPSRGVYDQPVQVALRFGGVVLMLVAAGLFAMVLRQRRRRA